MNPTIRIAAVCVVATTMLPGCGGLMQSIANLSPKNADNTLVEVAKNNEDLAALTQYCDKKFKKDNGKKLHYSAVSKACKHRHTVGVTVATREIDAATCETLKATWIKHKSILGSSSSQGALKKIFPAIATRLAKCGDYDYVFQDMIHWGQHVAGAVGRRALEAMDKAGLPVENAYISWLKKQSSAPYDHKLGPYALDHYLNWRLAKGGDIDCGQYVKPWSIFDGPEEMAWIYVFYRGTKCKASADWVTKGLVSPRAKTRHRACKTLGLVGNKSHTKNMSVLAKSDGTFKIVRYNKVYWVRDMCQQAVGQINMR